MGKKKCPEFENHERWLVSYADMVTLLFAVFVVLYSLNMAGGKKSEEKAAGSMQESFDTPLEDIPVDRKTGPAEAGIGIFENFKGDQQRKNIIEKIPSTNPREKIIDTEFNALKSKLEERLYGPEKNRVPTKAGEARIVEVQRTATGFKFQLLGSHFFGPNEIDINPRARKELDEVVALLKSLGRSVMIEGHTDSMPSRGKFNNWELSSLRATSVLQYIVRKHNFPPTKLSAAGFAEFQPIAHNGTESGRALNRRIEIKVKYEDEDPNL